MRRAGPYANLVSSGQAWLGDVPGHWNLAPLGTHFDERKETVSDQDFQPLSVTKQGVVPQMATAAKTDNGDSRKLVRFGDFAINARSDRKGSAGVSDLDGSVSVVYTILEPRPTVIGRFIHHLMRSSAFGEEYYRWGNGIVDDLWSTRFSAMKRIMLALPPLPEQQDIADFLDRETAQIDALMARQGRLIAALHERRAAVVERTVMEANPVWPVDKLGRQTRIGNGSTPRRESKEFWTDGDFPWLNSAVVNQFSVVSSDQFVTPQALAQCHLPIVPPGSILVGLTGQGRTRGMATLLQIQATVSQHVAYVTPRKCWDPGYLMWALRANYQHLRDLSDENGSTKGGLTCEDLKGVRVALPPLDEQRRIADYLDEQTAKIDALIAKAERFIEVSKERRSALITAAVTGQIDVRQHVSSAGAQPLATEPTEQEAQPA